MIRTIILFVAILFTFDLQSQSKYNGVSFVGSAKKTEFQDIQNIKKVAANSIAICPFAYLKSKNDPKLMAQTQYQWRGESKEGVVEMINIAHQQNIKVLLKPHIYVWGGEFVGFIKMKNDQDWLVFENRYRNYILQYAKIAEELDVEIFSIGVELAAFVEHRPAFWDSLIQEVRKIYTGKLTYAANWYTFKEFPHWDKLDILGMDQYFPLGSKMEPTLTDILKKWTPYLNSMKAAHIKYNKKVLFCEYGYRSVKGNTQEPWDYSTKYNELGLEAQQIALEALYQSVWNQNWFEGGFLWKWFNDYQNAGGIKNKGYTIQNKPAEQTVSKYYQLYSK